MSDEFCYIGGNVAENAGGGRAVKYGVTGRYVLGVEVVLPDGERIQVGGKRYKDVTGYDLLSLLVGSEGTLGIFTRIYLRLLPRPTERATVLSFFPSVDAAVDAIPRIVRDSGIVPTSVEFVDQLPLHKACEMLGETLPYQNAHAMLLLEADGRDAVVVQREAESMEEICRTSGASYVHRANDEADAERLWTIRKQVPWALRKYAQQQSLEDIALPPAALPDYIAELQMLASKYDVTIPSFGHAADGNLHATPLKRAAQTAEEWQETSGALLAEMYEHAARLGGTISGEHGIGHKRREYLPHVMSNRQIDLFRRIKDSFDPEHIMNPGKIVE
jgi:glycolate oxidase